MIGLNKCDFFLVMHYHDLVGFIIPFYKKSFNHFANFCTLYIFMLYLSVDSLTVVCSECI